MCNSVVILSDFCLHICNTLMLFGSANLLVYANAAQIIQQVDRKKVALST